MIAALRTLAHIQRHGRSEGLRNFPSDVSVFLLPVVPVQKEVTFAVVRNVDLPCCSIIGANFLSVCHLEVDFASNVIRDKITMSEISMFPLCIKPKSCNFTYHRFNINNFIGELSVSVDSDSVNSCESDNSDEYSANVRYLLTEREIIDYQNADPIIRVLKTKVVAKIPAKEWNDNNLSNFRFVKNLRVHNDLLLVDKENFSVPVLPFSLIVEIVFKVHTKLAHIGKRKLTNVINRKFFHPRLRAIASDICTTCQHCQLYKVSAQIIAPPIIKIQARYPFDLLAIDLLQFPRTKSGNVSLLVAVDHFSKFLFAIPMKDKKSSTVCQILQCRIFPNIISLPDRILTDNGPEFRSTEFNSLLDKHSISHVYSTRYKASGNGAVERTNRTIIEFLKGLIDTDNDWDVKINDAIIIYNSTYHAELKDTPSNFILKNAHNCSSNIPLNPDNLQYWKDSHPNFESFAIGDKVAQKVHKIGNSLKYKLGKKYTGPYEIVKIQSNGVSYEIRDSNNTIFKVHHKQLKPWKVPPAYLQDYLLSLPVSDTNSVEYSDHNSDSDDSDDIMCVGIPNVPSVSDNVSDNASVELNDMSERVQPIERKSKRKFRKPLIPVSFPELDLSKFNCSEVINTCDMEQKNNVNETFIIEKEFLDWLIEDNEIENIMDANITENFLDDNEPEESIVDQPQCIVSSPIQDEFDRHTLPLPSRLSSIGVNTTGRNDECWTAFLAWLDQSLSVQESLLFENSLNIACFLDSRISNNDTMHDRTVDSKQSESEVTGVIVSHLQHMRECVESFREANNGPWMKRFTPEVDIVNIALEASDILLDMSPDSMVRCTRSKGPAKEYPNVQPRTLEYKKRRDN